MIACAKRQEILHKIEAMVQIPSPLEGSDIKFPPPQDSKGVKCPEYARGGGGGGMLKL